MNVVVSTRRWVSRTGYACLLTLACMLPVSASHAAEPDPDVAPLQARLRNPGLDPPRNAPAADARLQARPAQRNAAQRQQACCTNDLSKPAQHIEESLLPGGRGARRPGGVMPLSRDR